VRVLIVDNFDSFTHNLAQLLGGLGAEVVVRRNDCAAALLLASEPTHVVLSPGPGTPDRTGHAAELLACLPAHVPVLGVCLGMQLLAVLAGATVCRAPRPVHGRATPLEHGGRGLFLGIPPGCAVGRYHSLAVDARTLPERLRPTAWSDGVLMAFEDLGRPAWGVQFHPESVLTPDGSRVLGNFLQARDLVAPEVAAAHGSSARTGDKLVEVPPTSEPEKARSRPGAVLREEP
jgi:anthranilate synthase/aminodeoxychorismate synthase-like glutamine amidotransferase